MRTRPITCCMCGGEAPFLGDMGSLRWYLCRACGAMLNRKNRPRKTALRRSEKVT